MDRVVEKQLIEQAQLGNAEAFSELYRDHVQAIFRYISHRVNDTQLAEDLTGDVFTKMVEGLIGYEDRGKPLRAWLYRIANARVVDHYRKVNRQPTQSDVEKEQIAVTPDMDRGLLRQQAAEALKQVMTELTADQQQVVVLRFIEGYRIDAVAQMMDKKPNAIKALQHRALRSLAKRLEESGFQAETILAGLS